MNIPDIRINIIHSFIRDIKEQYNINTTYTYDDRYDIYILYHDKEKMNYELNNSIQIMLSHYFFDNQIYNICFLYRCFNK